MRQYILYGNGGHARVLKDLIQLLDGDVVHIFDNDNRYDETVFPDVQLIIAIGNSKIREKVSTEIRHSLATLIHPKASIANDVIIGEGSVVLANAVVQAGCKIGKHCIINASAVIDHDVEIGDFVSIYPNAYIGGEAKITDHKIIEANAVVERQTIF